MKKHASSSEATFNPQAYKSFEGALEAFFAKECPQLGGFRTRQVLVQCIAGMVTQFYPESTHMKPGQINWPTVHKDETSSYGKSIKETRLTTVTLDLVQQQDAVDRAKGKKLRDIKREAVARLCNQSFEQGGCLTNAELAIMLKISPSTVGKYIKDWELEHCTVLPRRGSIHDLGPTLTHKKIIIQKLFVEGKSVQQVCRETFHSTGAVQRYISTFKQVLLCKQKNMNTDEIAFAIKHTKRLVLEYENLIEEYKENNYVLSELLKFEAKVESRRPEF